jgi:hypothetical protein
MDGFTLIYLTILVMVVGSMIADALHRPHHGDV